MSYYYQALHRYYYKCSKCNVLLVMCSSVLKVRETDEILSSDDSQFQPLISQYCSGCMKLEVFEKIDYEEYAHLHNKWKMAWELSK